MKKKQLITPDLTVKEVLDRYPQTMKVFMGTGLLCVGCPTEAFHSLADVAREYNLDLKQLCRQIFDAIGEDTGTLNSIFPQNNDINKV